MPWKYDDNGGIALDEHKNPIRIDETGQEKGVDGDASAKRLTETIKESVQRKERIRALEEALKPFEGIEDAGAWMSEAQKALEMMKNAPEKEKALEDQIRARVEAATKPLQEKLSSADGELGTLRAQLERESIGNAFNNSQFVNEKLINPALAAELFSRRFKLHEGKIVGLGDDGQPLYGAEGIAGFDEAMSQLVESSPYKAHLIKGSAASGSGAGGSSGGAGSGRPTSLTACKTREEQIAYLKAKTAEG